MIICDIVFNEARNLANEKSRDESCTVVKQTSLVLLKKECQCKQAMDFPDLQAKGFSLKVKFFNSLRSSQPARLHIELIVHIFPKLSFKTTESELHFKKMNTKMFPISLEDDNVSFR